MKIFLGITTYDRPEYLEICARSLLKSKYIADCSINIFDDCSPLWDNEFLLNLFPTASKIFRNEKNIGSDENIRKMFQHFLASDADLLIAVDSDFIFHPLWLEFVISNIVITDGILGIYNSSCHPALSTEIEDSTELVEKQHIGSACVVMRREIVHKIIENVPESSYYDWDWSKFLLAEKIRILVSKRSYVQHIGIYGYNNNGLFADYGIGFIPGSVDNEEINRQLFEKLLAIHIDELKKYVDS